MTANTIAYLRLKEEQRSNIAKERETQRSNMAKEYETQRHNVASLTETKRHNVVSETLSGQTVEEAERHNLMSEALSWANVDETQRHNLVNEELAAAGRLEEQRHNVALESVQWGNIAEGQRHNQALEVEAHRQAKAQEALRAKEIDVSKGLDLGRLEETIRHNKANEVVSVFDSAVRAATQTETARHNQVVEEESHRHNVNTEIKGYVDSGLGLLRSFNDILGIFGGSIIPAG